MDRTQKRFVRTQTFLLLFFIILSLVIVGYMIIKYWDVVSDPCKIQRIVSSFGIFAPFCLMFLQGFQVIVPYLPGQVLTIAGGYIYGIWWGTIINLIGVSWGSVGAFFISRIFGRPLIEKMFSKESLYRFDEYFYKHGLIIIFIIRTQFFFPNDFVSYSSGLVKKLSWKKFLLVTFLGYIPHFLLLSFIGKELRFGLVSMQMYSYSLVVIILGAIYLFKKQIYNFLTRKRKTIISTAIKENNPVEIRYPSGKLELLIDGKDSFSRIISRIRTAERTIYINMHIWRDDMIGNKIARELLQAADKGVKVFISKDAIGVIFEKGEENKQSFFHKKTRLLLWVQQRIIDWFYYTPGKSKSIKQNHNDLVNQVIDHENITVNRDILKYDHSKYYIFDDKILILGGMNIEDRALDRDVSGRKWNDYMCEIRDEQIIARFKKRISGKGNIVPQCRLNFVVNKNQQVKRFEIKPKIMELLSRAQKKVYVQIPYWGDKEIIKKIIETAGRGVKIFIILHRRSNILADLNLRTMREILSKSQGNISLYLSNNMHHAKMINVDERFTLIGSANFNRQAMTQANEVDILVDGKNVSFTKDILRNIKKHIGLSTMITKPSEIHFNRVKAFLESLVSS